MIDKSKDNWLRHQSGCGFVMPSAPRWKRLPIIRHIRCMGAALSVARHEERWRGMGLRSGYDQWVLYGIWRGWENTDD